MAELLIARKKNSNLIIRIIRRDNENWNAESFGSSGKDMNFEAVIKNKDPRLIAYLLYDLKNLGFPIEKALAKLRELTDNPDLFFLH